MSPRMAADLGIEVAETRVILLRAPGQSAVPMERQSTDRFVIRAAGAKVVFERDATGPKSEPQVFSIRISTVCPLSSKAWLSATDGPSSSVRLISTASTSTEMYSSKAVISAASDSGAR